MPRRKNAKRTGQNNKPSSHIDNTSNGHLKSNGIGTKNVSFGENRTKNKVGNQANSLQANGCLSTGGMHRSPSANTLSRLERQKIVLWRRPFRTFLYFILEVLHIVWDIVRSLLSIRRLLPTILLLSFVAWLYLVPGIHTEFIKRFEKKLLWCSYWIGLGILSSVGLGTGLHTFILYLGPHIARVTLAAFECNSLNFPEPPYPDDVTCPTVADSLTSAVSLWAIISKVRLESFMWGAGTALGELPPYFMARAARLSGEEPDDEEYKEFIAFVEGDIPKKMTLMDKTKLWMEKVVSQVGFPGILLFASIPNPLFDLAGITCGHFLIPFWTFFGATLIGKAIVKMHVQMLCVVLTFSEHHVENLVAMLKKIPHVGPFLQAPLKEFLQAQKIRLHRHPGDPVPEQATSLLQNCKSHFRHPSSQPGAKKNFKGVSNKSFFTFSS